jgi:8-oxo-dGTP pyrophosphatase MutT (NUDIX family)
MTASIAPKKWRTLSSDEIFKTSIFRFRSDRCELPDGRVMPRYFVMEFPDWVNVVPVTDDGQIVLVEQYRHAANEICIEIPGGSTDHTKREDPKLAAERELVEETGYTSSDVQFLAAHRPNPAMQNNLMHTYIARGCRATHEQNLDPFEIIRAFTVPIPEVVEMIFNGKINHSIVVASLLYALPALGFDLKIGESLRRR